MPIKGFQQLRPQAGKNLKPYQGLKLDFRVSGKSLLKRRKKPKTLSGIETELPRK